LTRRRPIQRFRLRRTPAERCLAWLLRKLSGGRLKLVAHPQPAVGRMQGGFFRGTKWPDVFTVTAQQTDRTAAAWGNLEPVWVDVCPRTKWACGFAYGTWRWLK